mgnify:CR=1 FL=1|jgi:hypothetical protein
MSGQQYDRTNTGALFKNDRKERDTHPDYRGSGNVAGEEFWLSGWLKKDRNGKSFMSLSFQPKDGQQAARSQRTQQVDIPLDDEIPF